MTDMLASALVAVRKQMTDMLHSARVAGRKQMQVMLPAALLPRHTKVLTRSHVTSCALAEN